MLQTANNNNDNRVRYPLTPPLPMSNIPSNQNGTWLVNSDSYSLNFEKVFQVYGRQPELLELILSSKVEEDRRRAEEAKLRRKEIDYMLQKPQTTTVLPPISKTYERLSSIPSTKAIEYNNKNCYELPPRRRTSNPIDMLLSSPSPSTSPRHPELKLPELSSLNKRPYSHQDDSNSHLKPFSQPVVPSLSFSDPIDSVKKRKKRPLQSITKIVKSKQFPYHDDYLWKNNGNTVYKKTGFKSIYYKCSNNSRGCPANKTVTFKGDGEHLIKYRGEHIPECSRFKLISDL